MPRQLRLELAGGIYHVMARGDRREAIFADNGDREQFLGVMGAVCQRHGWRVHAWVLMGNHYHLLLETPEPNLVSGMRQLQQTYTQRFNRRHRLSGHLFGGRYKAVLIQGELEGPRHQVRPVSADYFTVVADYIHLNPWRAGLVGKRSAKGLLGYRWSSLALAYARPPGGRAPWLEVGRVLKGYGRNDTAAGRRQMIEELEDKARAEAAEKAGLSQPEGQSLHASLRRGWYFGTQAFGERVLKVAGQAGANLKRRKGEHYEAARTLREHGEVEAARLISTALSTLGMNQPILMKEGRTKGDWRPVAVALLAQEKTMVSLAWLAKRCGLRNALNASQQLYRLRKEMVIDRTLAKLVLQIQKLASI